MPTYSYLIPLLIGAVIAGIGFKMQIPKGMAMNRPALGASLITCSLFWIVACALQLVSGAKISFAFNFLSIVLFFVGIAFFFKAPLGASRINQHGPLGTAFIWAGVVFGLVHGGALLFHPPWQEAVLRICASFGLTR
ncbi:hypothetical protein [Luteolibacter luteus]|uniref:Uncharacterized protein n=1 Tax=Luteolibacter luteus TaxID=2728835 RepID=A0A858RQV1_9BACT|nr:hypothetical protein [Luteolibacter luteus]QJE98303.1 hypothetical protein HHL09_21810 [Luteolibacter luteus]